MTEQSEDVQILDLEDPVFDSDPPSVPDEPKITETKEVKKKPNWGKRVLVKSKEQNGEDTSEKAAEKTEKSKRGNMTKTMGNGTLAAAVTAATIGLSHDSEGFEKFKLPRTGLEHGPVAVMTYCKNCKKLVISKTKKEIGVMTFVSALIFCFIGCVFGCCLIPFFTDSTKDTIHACPKCQEKIATYRQCGSCLRSGAEH